MILGIDEVGRGPWAGPLVVGAVVLGGETIDGLTDSKKLSKKRRDILAEEIYQKASGLGIGFVHAAELDELGLSRALRTATIRAVSQVSCSYDEIIIDGSINFLSETGKGKYVTTLAKADLLVPSVSAASIIAKVARDTYMEEMGVTYPEYGFEKHVGYGTAAHRVAIEAYGVTPLHRLSFAPLAKYRGEQIALTNEVKPQGITSKAIGDRAEQVVSAYLEADGHTIIARNWKTKYCEIDIVSCKDDTYFFTEVKYRKQSNQGGGIAAITSKKLHQMKFAAEYFALKNNLLNADRKLAVVEVSSNEYVISNYTVLD